MFDVILVMLQQREWWKQGVMIFNLGFQDQMFAETGHQTFWTT